MKQKPYNGTLWMQQIAVRVSGGTFVATLNGKAASCTESDEGAARALLRKLDPEGHYALDPDGFKNHRTYWTIITKGGRVERAS